MSFESLKDIVCRFQLVQGTVCSIEKYGKGHINDTFKVLIRTDRNEDQNQTYILQRINHHVFPRPEEVMENIVRVTKHLSKKISSRGGDPSRETLTLIPTVNNGESENYFFQDGKNNYWRMYNFISGATAHEIGEIANNRNRYLSPREINGKSHYFEAAAAYAKFQNDMRDIPPPRLHETIADFGDTAARFSQFHDALRLDSKGRAAACRDEIEFCLTRQGDTIILPTLLKEGNLQERIVHYDTKISNVLIDDETGRGLCVIDLDTVMPGLPLYDFGDCVRAAAALSTEDERDLSKVGFSMEIFELIVRGFLSIGNKPSDCFVDNMALAARIITLTQGLRFLADHLAGDVYYKVTRENHNLYRARTQLKMVAEMEARSDEMKRVIDEARLGN